MNNFMARLTKSYPVSDIKSKIGKISKRFDVMSVKVPSTIIPAMLASKLVTKENIISPVFVFLAMTKTSALCKFPVFVAVAFFAANSILPESVAYLSAGFFGMFFADTIAWARLSRFAHRSFRRRGMGFPFERAGTAFRRYLDFNADAYLAFGRKIIVSGIVFIKLLNRLPSFAARTSFKSIINSLRKFLDRQSSVLCGDFQCALWSLRHG